MKKFLAFIVLLASLSTSSYAALDVGDAAPNFTASAALGGKVFKFTLADSLAKGPVVLYFFPAAFSVALKATVIGVSSDDIETLGKFSVQACQGKFPVASDDTQAVMKSYDAVMALRPDYANRVSYVIAPNGKVIYNYQSLNPSRHVEKTLAALKDWSQAKK